MCSRKSILRLVRQQMVMSIFYNNVWDYDINKIVQLPSTASRLVNDLIPNLNMDYSITQQSSLIGQQGIQATLSLNRVVSNKKQTQMSSSPLLLFIKKFILNNHSLVNIKSIFTSLRWVQCYEAPLYPIPSGAVPKENNQMIGRQERGANNHFFLRITT